jgi:acyl-CoA synthetase (AMP-forming)/AMP-acid ligase II
MKTANLIHNLLEHSAHAFPDKVAVIHEDVRATYTQINGSANQLACWLVRQGVSHGDRVVLLLENSLEYVVSYNGALKAGAVAVPLNTDLKPDSLRPLLNELDPAVIISSPRSERLLQATDLSCCHIRAVVLKGRKLPWPSAAFQIVSWEELVHDEATPNLDISIDESALASIVYTSGSTGSPKGVMLSHKNVVANTRSICQSLRLTEQDIQMVVLPFFYVMGKSLLNTHLAVGGTVVINNRFAFPATVIKQMVEEQVTGFSGVPSTYAHLLHRSPLGECRDQLKSLRYCSQAGGHMPQQIKESLRQTLPANTKIYIMYGATEASARLTYLEPDRFEEKAGSIGKPIPGVTLKVLDENGQESPDGRSGELVGDGPNIMQGYWKDQDATARVLDHHGYHTGDLGFRDKDGFFYVTGRKDDLLKVGGHKINPREIEDAIMDTGLAIEVVVIGVPDGLLGKAVVALVVPKNDNCEKNRLLSLCAEKLPKYKLPKRIELVGALPKNSGGKIDRSGCLALVEQGS